jgi:hypothetical protein
VDFFLLNFDKKINKKGNLVETGVFPKLPSLSRLKATTK